MSIAESRSALPTAELASLADKQLLSRFFRRRDDAAFTALVQRHGPLVYRVCRRVLPDANDAEDAFQATFLVLVRKGDSLKQPERLACWLYGVAVRTARKIKVRSAIRSKHEREAHPMPVSADVDRLTLQELQAVLDEEIGKLPEKYALPLTLCYLEGKTNAQAAAQLGWPEGSISRRLSRARELLRSRLVRRGLAMSAALIAAVFARSAEAAPPADLLAHTASAGNLLLRGVPLEELVSKQTAAVVQDVLSGSQSMARLSAAAFLATSSVALAILVSVWPFPNNAGPRSLNSVLRTWSTPSHAVPGPPPVAPSCSPPATSPATIAAAPPSGVAPAATP
jgi:RNA polymerase sigma-70 factor (ECF subfamily)